MVMRSDLIIRVMRAFAAVALRSSALRCFVQSLATDLVSPRIAAAGELNFAIGESIRKTERGLAAIGEVDAWAGVVQDHDNRFAATDPQLTQMRFQPLAAVAAERAEWIPYRDGEVDAGDDPPVGHLLWAVAECRFDNPRQATGLANRLFVFERFLVDAGGLEPSQQMILADQPEQMRPDRAAM